MPAVRNGKEGAMHLQDLPFAQKGLANLPNERHDLGSESLMVEQLSHMGLKLEDVVDIYPCSPLQEGILLNASSSYAVYWIWRCWPTKQGQPVSATRLSNAWKTATSMHGIFSTIFSHYPGQRGFVQFLLRDAPVPVSIMDCSPGGCPAEMLEKVARPQFPAHKPRVAVTICRSSAYAGGKIDKPNSFQRVIQHIEAIPKSETVGFWAEFLKGIRSCQFPVFLRSSADAQLKDDHAGIHLPELAFVEGTSFCKRNKITRSVFIHLAWALVLSYYTDMDEVCFGYMASGRDVPVEGIKRICGPLANLVVSRLDLRGGLNDLFQSIGLMLKQHRRHQQTPLAEVRHRLGISERLFNTAINLLRPDAVDESGKNEFTFEKHLLVSPHEFDLVLEGYLEPDTVRATLYYRTSSLNFQVAAEVGDIFIKATEYLCSLEPLLQGIRDHGLDANPEPSSELPDRVFHYIAHCPKKEALELWQSHLAGMRWPKHDEPFAPSHERYELQCTIGSSGTMKVCEVEMVMRATWAILLAQMSNSDEAIFGVASIEQGPSKLDCTLSTPSRVLMDWEGSVEKLMRAVENDAECGETLKRAGVHRLRQVSENKTLTCNFEYLLALTRGDRSALASIESDVRYRGCTVAASCFTNQDQVVLAFSFNQEKMTRTQGQKFKERFTTLFQRLLSASPEQRISSVVTADEQDLQDIWSWNRNVPATVNLPITNLFAEQVQSRPDALAIHAWDGDFTYKELDTLSTQLAKMLLQKSVGPGKVVPLCFEKCKWMSVCMLGVVKTGAAGAGLDPHQPEERLRSVLEELQPDIILSSTSAGGLISRISSSSSTLIVDGNLFEEHDQEQQSPPQSQVLPQIEPTAALYVVFTSGSTGKPKGVIISHQNYSTAVSNQWDGFGFDPSCRVLDFSSYAFDAAWFNLLHTLTSGGCLCVLSDDERQDNLGSCFEKYGITLSFLTPSVVRHLDCASLCGVKTLLVGGEAVLPGDVKQLLTLSELQLKIVYGPTECTPMATCFALSRDGPVALGKGLGACTWVVHPHNPHTLLPIGVVGELCIEGGIVGHGYWNDDIKTAHSFIQDPEWLTRDAKSHPGRHGLVYLTGDLVRYEKDGTLVFVGRKDNQVKIRGQRVELLEIEQNILSYLANSLSPCNTGAGIQVVAETIRYNDAAIIIAFIAISTRTGQTQEDNMELVRQVSKGLREHMLTNLPSYMIPAAFLPLAEVPLTITGKVNRALLREVALSYWQNHDSSVSADEKSCIPPTTDMEKKLHEIWASILNLPPKALGITEVFMCLGGDSITAMQVVAKCRRRGLLVKVVDILQAETIQKLALRCKRVASQAQQQSTAGSGNEDTGMASRDFELSPIQAKFFHLFPKGLNYFNQSFILDLNHTVHPDTMSEALRAVVKRHGLLRARYKKDGKGSWVQYIREFDNQSFTYAVHTVVSRSQALCIAQDSQQRIDIVNGPVFGVDMFNLEDGQQMIALTAHHLVVDLVSWRIIWHDIEDYVKNRALPDQTATPFREWCHLQAQAACALTPGKVLPFDIPKPNLEFWGLPLAENTRDTSEDCIVELDDESTRLLMNASNLALRSEPIDIILGVYAYSFSAMFPERTSTSAVIFLEGHGREMSDNEAVDVSGTVGWFTTVHPVSVPIGSKMSASDAVRYAKDMRRKVPDKGQPYFASRYNSEECRQAFSHHDEIELLLNFGGTYQQLESADGLFKLSPRFDGGNTLEVVSGTSRRLALIEVNTAVESGKLIVTFTINRHLKHAERLKKWINSFIPILKQVVQELAQTEPVFTRSDVPLLTVSDCGLLRMHQYLLKQEMQPKNVANVYPATPLQHGILLSSAMGKSSYSTFWIWDCVSTKPSNHVSLDRLEAAWRTVASRHDIFSTIFVPHPEEDRFLQVVLKGLSHRVQRLQITSGIPREVLYKMARPEFSKNEPEISFTVCRDEANNVCCRLDINHTLIDGMSLTPLIQELTACYVGEPLPPVTQLRSFVEFFEKIDKKHAIDRWKKHLECITPCEIELPTTRKPGPEVGADSVRYLAIPNIASSQILEFCKGFGISRAVFLQVCWAMVLAKLSGSTDVCFGYLVSGRDAPIHDIDKMLGPMANMIPCRVELGAEPVHVLKTVATNSIEHLDYQHVSLAEIQHAIGLSGRRLFNTAVTVRAADKFEAGGNESITFQYYDHQDPHEYDLLLSSRLDADETEVSIQIRNATVTQEYADNAVFLLSTAIDTLLAVRVEIGDCHPSECGSLEARFARACKASRSSAQNSDLEKIWSWNRTVPEASTDTILDLFNRTALSRPASTAICAWDGELTYSKLDELATGFHHRLLHLDLDLRPGSIVPLCFEKSMWCAVAMLAVMKTGAASVLLDSSQPKDRLRTITSQVPSRVILVSSSCANMAQEIAPGSTIIIIDEHQAQAGISDRNCRSYSAEKDSAPKPSDMAYVVFTSGSTGVPKGTILTHGNISSSIRHQQAALGITSESRIFDFASYAFDIAWCNFFQALTSGACLCIPSEADRLNRVEDSFTELRANYAHITPTLLRYLDLAKMEGLTVLNLSGEAVAVSDGALVPDRIKLVNAYGPAETNVVTLHELSELRTRSTGKTVPIGRGAGACTWVVDADDGQRLLPIGEVGELWIEGPLVGAGYLSDYAGASLSFVKDPTWLLHGINGTNGRRGTLYRTGDLVVYDQDGALSYVGRKDTQVKIRGQRVELEEVEHQLSLALARTGLVNAKTVVELVHPKGADQPVLVAFIHTSETANLTKTQLQEATWPTEVLVKTPKLLADKIPLFMVPTVYMLVDKIPRTASAKTDRRSLNTSASCMELHEMESWRKEMPRPKGGSLTPAQETMRTLWAAILGADPRDIGSGDHFFRIGGDSIDAMRLARLATDREISLTVANIFQNPILCDLAAIAEPRTVGDEDSTGPFSLLPKNTDAQELICMAASRCHVEENVILDVFPCTTLQASLMQKAVSTTTELRLTSSHTMELRQGVDLVRVRRAWDQVSRRAAILRTRIFHNDRCGWLQAVLDHGVQWSTYKTLKEAQQQQHSVQNNMGQGTELVRFGLVEPLNGKPGHFIITLHWAVYDGWALRTLFAEAERLYEDDTTDNSLYGMASFVHYIDKIDKERALRFWEQQFDGMHSSPFPPVPKTNSRSSPSPDRYDHVTVSLPEIHLTQRDFTAATVIRAALSLAIAAANQSDEALFGATVTGRQAAVPGIDRIAGPTFATLPIRIPINRKDTVRSLLSFVQTQAAEMIPFEQLGLDRIRQGKGHSALACDFRTLLVIQSGIREGDPRHGGGGEDCNVQGMFAHGLVGGRHAIVELGQRTGDYAIFVEAKLGGRLNNTVSLSVCIDTVAVSMKLVNNFAQLLQAMVEAVGNGKNLDLLAADV